MPEAVTLSPAEAAAEDALKQVFLCIRERKHFRLEAGAGAGKTYSLVKALQQIVQEEGTQLIRRHQKVACITYTNVATDEVNRRTDDHPAIHASTIHSFCWELCKNFQSILRKEVPRIPRLNEMIVEAGGIKGLRIVYDLGHRQVTEEEVLLHHDDVLKLMVALLDYPKFRRILTARFPVLLIDEYQDTDAELADSIIRNFVDAGEGLLIGLFGDSWQKIYRSGTGAIQHDNLKAIGKEANFRSVPAVVDVLNRIRPDLPQAVKDPVATGTVKVYHSNNFAGLRRAEGHWKGELPTEVAHDYLSSLREQLEHSGWDFSPTETKVLMLTHNVLGTEQNYSQILNVFDFKDSLFRKEDPHIAFLVDTVEPACEAFSTGNFGEMFLVIGGKVGRVKNFEEKRAWARDMRRLVGLRKTGTIGEVLDHLQESRRPRLPEAVLRNERWLAKAKREEIDESRVLRQIENLRPLPYSELISLAAFINNKTPFSTKHGVKGAEFENVLGVFGRGWNQYNWNQFLEWFPDCYPPNKKDSYERNRNLFYVACSRPKKNLALLFTQQLSTRALKTLEAWFGPENIVAHDLH